MALDANGLTVQSFTEILENLNNNLKANLGQTVDTSENSLLGVINNLLASSLADLNELAQGLYDSTFLLKAEGEALENLALLVGFLRFPATSTTGIAYFTGVDGTNIPPLSQVASVRGDVYTNSEEIQVTATDCVNTRLAIAVVQDNEDYVVTIDGTTALYTSDGNATITEILTGLEAAISANSEVTTNLVIAAVEEDSYVEIDKVNKNIPMSVTATSYITFPQVTTPANIQAEETGAIAGDAGSIINILTPIVGWSSVINPTDFPLGTNLETDEELRLRVLSSYNTVGTSTPDTISAKLRDVANVTAVKVKENITEVIDGDGIPPKSYECIVNDGDAQEIGQVIWETKPAGIRTHGDVAVVVKDFNEQEHTVNFSRPTTKYAHIDVYYTKYDEESFPVDGEDTMKQSMLEFGDTLTIDNDIIPQRFVGEIYQNVSGILNLDIEIATTANPTDDPLITPVDPFTNLPIAVSDEEISSFAINRMTITEGVRP